jgi:hypothetical protein
MRALVVVVSLFAAVGHAAAPAEKVVSSQEVRDFVFAKMAYDEQYFAKVLAAHEQGRALPGVERGAMGK